MSELVIEIPEPEPVEPIVVEVPVEVPVEAPVALVEAPAPVAVVIDHTERLDSLEARLSFTEQRLTVLETIPEEIAEIEEVVEAIEKEPDPPPDTRKRKFNKSWFG